MKHTILTAVLALAALTATAQTQIVAHRGYHAKEGSARNTISSLRNAQELGVYGSECDINMTADDSLLVIHGMWHTDKNDPTRVHAQKDKYKDIRSKSCEGGNIVPTFREYLAQVKKDPKVRLVIEIKSHATPERELQVTHEIVKQVAEAGLEKQVDYIAFSSVVCDELVKIVPKGTEIAYLNGDWEPAKVKERGYTGIDYSQNVLKKHPEWIKQAHKLGLKVNVWTVDDPEAMRWFIDRKVDFLTTDDPVTALGILNGEKK